MSFRDAWVASRRLAILRLLVEVGGEANSSILHRGFPALGFGRDTRETLERDLDYLAETRCVTAEWLEPTVRVVALTRRGEDAAHGRTEIAGIEYSRWRRGE